MNSMSNRVTSVPSQQDMAMPETPGSGNSGAHSESEMDDNMDGVEEVNEMDVNPNLHSDSESSSSSSSSSDSEGDDDMVPETYAPPPSVIPGAAPISLSQATAMNSSTS